MGGIDLEGPEPIYRQIAAVIAKRIADGLYPPRRAIPSEAAMCEEFGVGRNTVRAAVALLAEQGLVITVKGKGSYVVEQHPPSGAKA
jgi:DNA-binding GntR family transcriptional regulator